MNINQRLKILRLRLGITQSQLARLSGVSWISIQKIESEKMQPTFRLSDQILTSLGVEIGLTGHQADWQFLRSVGVPLMEDSINVKPSHRIDLTELVKQIRYGLLDEEPRRRKALLAFLLALKTHFPKIYKRLKVDPLKNFDVDEIIKLKRLALARLAEVF